jgi:serine/threonine-protein phosphatase 2B catalytic subunit
MQMINSKSGIPRVITIFSAPNYCDVYKNKAACIEFDNNLLNIRQFVCSPHPYYLPNFMDVFEWSLPFVAEKVTDMLASIMQYNADRDSDDELETRPRADSHEMNADQTNLVQSMLKKRGGTLKQKVVAVAKLARVFAILRQENENCVQLKQLTPNHKLPFGLLREGKDAIKQVLTSFEEARLADRVNERMPHDGKAPITNVPFLIKGKRASTKKKL